jgi:hypothetical protein
MEQSSSAFAAAFGDVASKGHAPWTLEEHPSHDVTLVRGSDVIATEWGGQDSNPRHEG